MASKAKLSKAKLSGRQLLWYEIVFESDTKKGRMYDILLLVCIVVSVVVVALESVSTLPAYADKWLFGLEWFFTIIFTLDYV